MDCDFGEKVSMLIDGELPSTEIELVRKHITACAECQNFEEDFLFFRRQIKTSVLEHNTVGQAKIAAAVGKKNSFWVHRISLPVPALAVFAFLLVCLGAWIISLHLNRTRIDTTTQTTVKNTAPKMSEAPGEMSLARYDAGGRAEIYIVPRQTK